jgi:ATP-dependent RNA helicase DeaD
MGFIDDIEWILDQTPPTRQVALFSATLPAQIRRIAQKHLKKPVEITIQSKTSTAANIRQRYWLVSGLHKLDALTRILEAETFDGMLIFVRTKLETVDLADRLQARGFDAAPLNGDIPQQQRERTVNALKAGKVDIVVATDVAARGLDVERISHVVNYDVPYDSESYIHRIGRTGRAGRKGEAILFIAPRERNMLRIIERATRQQIEQMSLPSIADVNEQRVARFKQRITEAVTAGEGAVFRELIEEFEREQSIPAIDIAAALASLLQGGAPLLLPERPERQERIEGGERGEGGGRHGRGDARGDSRGDSRGHSRRETRGDRVESAPRKHRGADRGDRGAGHTGAGADRADRGAGYAGGGADRGDRGAGRTDRGASHVEKGADRSGGHADRGAAHAAHAAAAHVHTTADKADGSAEHGDRGAGHADRSAGHADRGDRGADRGGRGEGPPSRKPRGAPKGIEFETYRIEVGHAHGVKPGNIVGAIANEAGLEGRHIGHVDIREDHSFVDLPEGMPKEIFRSLKKVRVVGRELQIVHASSKPPKAAGQE